MMTVEIPSGNMLNVHTHHNTLSHKHSSTLGHEFQIDEAITDEIVDIIDNNYHVIYVT